MTEEVRHKISCSQLLHSNAHARIARGCVFAPCKVTRSSLLCAFVCAGVLSFDILTRCTPGSLIYCHQREESCFVEFGARARPATVCALGVRFLESAGCERLLGLLPFAPRRDDMKYARPDKARNAHTHIGRRSCLCVKNFGPRSCLIREPAFVFDIKGHTSGRGANIAWAGATFS